MNSAFKAFLESRGFGDWFGFFFFSAIAIYAAGTGIREKTPWMILPLLHNGMIAVLFLVRRPARKEDGAGLALAILAILWPTGTRGVPNLGILGVLGLLGLILIFWALGTLGTSFGIAPADRELVTRGPYRIIRHPMYLGELVYQAAALGMNFSIIRIGMFLIFASLQVARIQREERVIENYPGYAQKVRWRLLYGVW